MTIPTIGPHVPESASPKDSELSIYKHRAIILSTLQLFDYKEFLLLVLYERFLIRKRLTVPFVLSIRKVATNKKHQKLAKVATNATQRE